MRKSLFEEQATVRLPALPKAILDNDTTIKR
jgi:hypothetical protein